MKYNNLIFCTLNLQFIPAKNNKKIEQSSLISAVSISAPRRRSKENSKIGRKNSRFFKLEMIQNVKIKARSKMVNKITSFQREIKLHEKILKIRSRSIPTMKKASFSKKYAKLRTQRRSGVLPQILASQQRSKKDTTPRVLKDI